MNEKQIFALIAIVVVYLWWHAKGMTAYSTTGPGGGNASGPSRMMRGVSSSSPNTVYSTASTTPRTRRQLPGRSSPWRGDGTGYTAVPVLRTGQIINPYARAVGGARQTRGTISRSSTSAGTAAISPRWPRTQVNSLSSVRLGNGAVQVPGWAAAPSLTHGPGGQGTIVYGG